MTKRTSVYDRLTKHLTSLANRRVGGTVTADDAQRVLDRWNYRGERQVIGNVLRTRFTSVGFARSTVKSNRSRTIRVWTPAA